MDWRYDLSVAYLCDRAHSSRVTSLSHFWLRCGVGMEVQVGARMYVNVCVTY